MSTEFIQKTVKRRGSVSETFEKEKKMTVYNELGIKQSRKLIATQRDLCPRHQGIRKVNSQSAFSTSTLNGK